MSNLDLLSIGDATLDVFLTPAESEILCRLDKKDCLVCFTYGDKIPVKHLEFSVGGNAANNAVGTRRLGINTGLVLTLGDDTVGHQIVEKLQKEKVDLTFVIQQPAATSNYSTIINYSGERTIFTYHAPRSYEFPVKLPATPWIYLTSMGESYRPFYNHFIAWLKINPQVRLAFNPGTWQLQAADQLKDILLKTYMLYVNKQEAQKLTGLASEKTEKELLKALFDLGVKIPVVTDGGNGSFAFDGVKYYKAEVLPLDAFERTGAGDAFGSGCLAALIKGLTLPEALLWGTVNSASVIGFTGSQRGLLKQEEMPEWLERAKSSNVKVGEF